VIQVEAARRKGATVFETPISRWSMERSRASDLLLAFRKGTREIDLPAQDGSSGTDRRSLAPYLYFNRKGAITTNGDGDTPIESISPRSGKQRTNADGRLHDDPKPGSPKTPIS